MSWSGAARRMYCSSAICTERSSSLRDDRADTRPEYDLRTHSLYSAVPSHVSPQYTDHQ